MRLLPRLPHQISSWPSWSTSWRADDVLLASLPAQNDFYYVDLIAALVGTPTVTATSVLKLTQRRSFTCQPRENTPCESPPRCQSCRVPSISGRAEPQQSGRGWLGRADSTQHHS